MASPNQAAVPDGQESAKTAALIREVVRREPQDAANLLLGESEPTIAAVLVRLPTAKALALLPRFSAERRVALLKAVPEAQREQWLHNQRYPAGSVGHLMEPAVAVFAPTLTVREAVARLRDMVHEAFVTYGYVVDGHRRLIGALVMRELLLASPDQPLREVMLANPFSLKAAQQVAQIIPLVQARHFAEYPVCDDEGRIIGIVRGYALFHEQVLALSAQPGKMAGNDREERILTQPWRSLSLRQPWLQINLLSSLMAASVVGYYETTIVQVVAAAAFVPVMVGQSAGTGAQALAVALRGLTLGEFHHENWRGLIGKEVLVGIGNGALVGLTAAAGIYAYAQWHGHAGGKHLALVMVLAMIVSTTASGVVGGVMPFAMKRLGFDPATAATILVGGVTRIVSIAAFLALTRWMLL